MIALFFQWYKLMTYFNKLNEKTAKQINLRLEKAIPKKMNFQTKKNYGLKLILACSPTQKRSKNVYMFILKINSYRDMSLKR